MGNKAFILVDECTDVRGISYNDFLCMSNNIQDLKDFINTEAGDNLIIFSTDTGARLTHWSKMTIEMTQVNGKWVEWN